jgi:Putative bacterial sensory transduction regulator
MTDFETVKGLLQELQLAIVAEDPAEGILVVEDEERGLKHLVVDCEAPILIFAQRILAVPTPPDALFRRLLQMNRTLVHGAFVLDEAGKSVLLHDTLALAHVDLNEVQGTIDAFSLALAEHAQELIAFSRQGTG